MKFVTVVAEGPHVAIQAESDTVASNGKKYANRYHFYFLFDGDHITQVLWGSRHRVWFHDCPSVAFEEPSILCYVVAPDISG